MKELLIILFLIPAVLQAQVIEHPLPTKKPYPYPMGYLEYVPSWITPCSKKPKLLIFLHGIGEGTSKGKLSIVANAGLPALAKAGKVPVDSFLILCPQGPKYISIPALHAFIQYAKKTYAAATDTSVVYLTGLSGGAITGANYCRLYTSTAAVFCAGFPNYKDLCNQKSTLTPMLLFHNKGDNIVGYTGDVQFENLYNKCVKVYNDTLQSRIDRAIAKGEILPPGKPKEPAVLTLYEGGGHDVWTRTYKDPEIYYWLLKHTK